MSNRAGDWMQTATGRQFWPLDPRVEEVFIEDIAHALSNQCRFAGHCRDFYSVAQHSVLVSLAVPANLALARLLHDAAEAYLVDLPRPVKRSGIAFAESYREMEHRVADVICDRFDLQHGVFDRDEIKQADNVVLMTEARDLMRRPPVTRKESRVAPLPDRIAALDPAAVQIAFLKRFYSLFGLSDEDVRRRAFSAVVETRNA